MKAQRGKAKIHAHCQSCLLKCHATKRAWYIADPIMYECVCMVLGGIFLGCLFGIPLAIWVYNSIYNHFPLGASQ